MTFIAGGARTKRITGENLKNALAVFQDHQGEDSTSSPGSPHQSELLAARPMAWTEIFNGVGEERFPNLSHIPDWDSTPESTSSGGHPAADGVTNVNSFVRSPLNSHLRIRKFAYRFCSCDDQWLTEQWPFNIWVFLCLLFLHLGL